VAKLPLHPSVNAVFHPTHRKRYKLSIRVHLPVGVSVHHLLKRLDIRFPRIISSSLSRSLPAPFDTPANETKNMCPYVRPFAESLLLIHTARRLTSTYSLFKDKLNVPSHMKVKSTNIASTASISCMRPNFTLFTVLFYSFGMNQGDVTSFAQTRWVHCRVSKGTRRTIQSF
jgi:hypothetical protein